VPSDTDGAWSRMTEDYKTERAGGREGYEAFWADIERVETRNVTADPPDRAEATLTYYFKDGRVVDEQTEYRLEKQDGTMKIDRSEVISSSTR
jgi:protein subunit release factor A